MSSGEKAIERVHELSPDCILMDIILKGDIDGIAAAKSINKIASVPIIYITANSDEAIINKVKETNPYGFIVKPINQNELFSAIEIATYKHEMEHKLKESEKLFQIFAENVNDLFWMMDENFNITYMSPAIERIRGFSFEEVKSQNFQEMLLPQSHEILTEEIKNQLALEKTPHNDPNRVICLELQFYHKFGNPVWVEVNAQFLRDDKGKIIGYIGVDRDINSKKKIENELRKSYNKYRILTENFPDLILRFDKNSICTFINNSVEQKFNLKIGDLIGKNIKNIPFLEKVSEQFEDSLKKVYSNSKDYECEFSIKTDGVSSTYDWRFIPEFNVNNQVYSVLNIARDITIQKQMEQNFKMLFDQMLDGFALHEIITDENGTPIDYKFLMINPAFEKMTGLKADDVVGANILDVFPDTEKHWIDTYGKVALTGEPIRFQNYAGAMNKWFEVTAFSPEINQFATLFLDITEKKNSLQNLKESEERFRSLVEASPDAVIITDIKGALLEISRETAQMHGYVSVEELMMNVETNFDLVVPDEDGHLVTVFETLLNDGIVKNDEFKFKRKNGSFFPAELSGTLITEDEGKPVGFTFIVRDMTERKRADRVLIENEEKYRLLFESNSDAIMIFDAENKKFEDANRITLELFGYTKEEFLKKTAFDLSDEKIKIQEIVASIISLKTNSLKIPLQYFVRKDGTTFPGEISTGTFESNGRLKVIGTVRDITDRKLTEDIIIKQKELAVVLNNANDYNEAFATVFETVISLGYIDSGGVYLYEPDAGIFNLVYSTGFSDSFKK